MRGERDARGVGDWCAGDKSLVSLVLLSCLVPLFVRAATVFDPAEFGFSPDAAPEVNAAALQKALDGGNRTVKVSRPGEYRLDRTILMDDDTTLDCAKGVVFLKVGKYPQMIANRGAYNYTTNRNLAIRGLRIKGNAHDMWSPSNSSAPGLRGQIGFVRVRNVEVRNFICTDFGMRDGGAWRPFAKRDEVGADIRNVVFKNIKLNARRGINCGWEINKYARMVHPDIPEKDWPVIDITLENIVATTDFPVIDGFANAKVRMRNVRSKGPLYQERFRDDKNSTIRKGMYYRTKVDLTVEDCEFSDEVRTAPDFRFTDERGSVRVNLGKNDMRRPLRIENATADFQMSKACEADDAGVHN